MRRQESRRTCRGCGGCRRRCLVDLGPHGNGFLHFRRRIGRCLRVVQYQGEHFRVGRIGVDHPLEQLEGVVEHRQRKDPGAAVDDRGQREGANVDVGHDAGQPAAAAAHGPQQVGVVAFADDGDVAVGGNHAAADDAGARNSAPGVAVEAEPAAERKAAERDGRAVCNRECVARRRKVGMQVTRPQRRPDAGRAAARGNVDVPESRQVEQQPAVADGRCPDLVAAGACADAQSRLACVVHGGADVSRIDGPGDQRRHAIGLAQLPYHAVAPVIEAGIVGAQHPAAKARNCSGHGERTQCAERRGCAAGSRGLQEPSSIRAHVSRLLPRAHGRIVCHASVAACCDRRDRAVRSCRALHKVQARPHKPRTASRTYTRGNAVRTVRWP